MKTYRNLFNNLGTRDPSPQLSENIMKEVRRFENKKIRIRFILSSLIACASLGGIIESVLRLIQSSNQSGFFQYLSLLFSDSATFFSYWKEFAFSLAESLPLMSVVLLLSVVAVFLWSTSRALKDAEKTFLPA